MRTRRLAWLVVGVLIVAALVAVRAKRVRDSASAPTVEVVAPVVTVARVSRGDVVQTRHVLGTVLGADTTEVTPRLMSNVVSVNVREGEVVRRGAVLAVLDAREMEDSVGQSKARLAAAREQMAAAEVAFQAQETSTASDQVLFQAKAIAQEQWDRSRAAQAAASARREAARAEVAVADRALDQARTRLGYTRLAAPFDGVVSARRVDPGDLAVPGRPLLEIVRQGTVRVRAELPPEDLPALKAGTPVTLTLAEARLQTAVSRVFPALGPRHLVVIETDVQLPPPGFVSGATVAVDVHLRSASGLVVPADTLLEGEDGHWVFRVAGGVVHPVRVEIVNRSETQAVVTGDLHEGDDLVEARPSRLMTLAEGTAVSVAR